MADTNSLDKNSPTQTQDKSNDTKVPLMGLKTSCKEQENFLKFHFDGTKTNNGLLYQSGTPIRKNGLVRCP